MVDSANICTGRGDRGGGHCCWIDGQLCPLYDPQAAPGENCTVWDQLAQQKPPMRWRATPVGRWFAANHPGFTCRDWPQNIPDVMAQGSGLCCWQGAR